MMSQIVAIGGARLEPENDRLHNYVLSLVEKPRPKVCFIPTASGDSDSYIVSFYESFTADRCTPSHLCLFDRSVTDLRSFVFANDVIYVGGGNTANMLAVWRTHGLDDILRDAWNAGVLLCGSSAGAICWFEASVTDSFGGLRPLSDGLGLLPGSMCSHYDSEPERRPSFQEFVAEGLIAEGIAADDLVALHFIGPELRDVVALDPGASAYRVSSAGGRPVEEAIPARHLDREQERQSRPSLLCLSRPGLTKRSGGRQFNESK